MLNQNLLLAGDDAYNLTKSLRFRSSASAYLNRTFSTPTNNKIWTWSGWIKRGKLSGSYAIIGTTDDNGSSGNYDAIRFTSSDTLEIYEYASAYTFRLITTQVFRDPSAWYHIVLAFDTTQATSTNRIKLYVNGVQVTAFGTSSYPSQNLNTYINSAIATYQGALNNASSGVFNLFDGYLTEVNFIDGQALTPSSFGQTNSATGVWQPIKYSGTYGTNGFYLNFSDNSNNTATTIGKDYSGNGNNWTPNNISVTSGATYDSMTDVPTLTSATAANYAVMNSLWKDSTTVIAQGNLDVSNGNYGGFSTLTIPTSSKFYAEFTVTATQGNQGVGILKAANAYSGVISQTDMFGSNSVTYYSTNGNKFVLGGGSTAYGSSWGTIGDVIGIAVNTVDNQITFYKNNVSQGVITGLTSGIEWVFATGNQTNTGGGAWNFGQRPFAYTPPTGFVALNTFNLPTPTIGATASTQANDYFNATLYTGNNSTQSVTGVGFQPDFVWIKERDAVEDHFLFDSVRGATNFLRSNTTDAQGTLANYLTAFNSDGFSLGNGGGVNGASDLYVSWNWRASNATAVTNTAGSITSTVSANTTAGFSIVTYTGTGANATVGHGLGVAPSMIIARGRSAGTAGFNWRVYHGSLAATAYLEINLTSAQQTDATVWNSTAPTSSVFSLGSSGNVNGSTQTYVAYCFAQIAGYSAFGSFTGNGSADGPFIYLGFRPKFFLYKKTSSTSDWWILDATRNTYNIVDAYLFPNLSNAEGAQNWFDFTANGLKMRDRTDVNTNGNGSTYIYMAFAESPFKYSLAR